MKIAVLAAIAVLPMALAAQPHCPELPSGAPVHWRHDRGPDFDACLALNGDNTVAFALYRGNIPALLAQNLTRGEVGTVAGKPVRWYSSGQEGSYQAELFLSTDDSIRVFVPREPASTFTMRVKLVGAMRMEHEGAP